MELAGSGQCLITGGKVFHKKGTLIRVPVDIDSRADHL